MMLGLTRRGCFAFAGLVALLLAETAHAQLVATYQFGNTLAADQAGAPALTAINSGSFVADNAVLGQSRTVYQRTSGSSSQAAQSALRLDTSALSLTANNYAVELVFTFTDNLNGGGYRRILNSYDPGSQSDAGFYVGPGNTLDIYQSGSHGGGSDLANGTYYDVVLSVSPAGERAYLNGSLMTSHAGTPDMIYTHYLTFFQDDGSEYGNGKLALLRVFDQALTGAEVATLNNNGNPFVANAVPESGTFALLLIGGWALVSRRKGRPE